MKIEDRIRHQAARSKALAERRLYRNLRRQHVTRDAARDTVAKMWNSRQKELPSKTRVPSRSAGYKVVS